MAHFGFSTIPSMILDGGIRGVVSFLILFRRTKIVTSRAAGMHDE